MKQKQNVTSAGKVLTVATAHTVAGLREALRLRAGDADIIEVRLDCLASRERLLDTAVPAIRVPVLLTARHPSEGGSGGFTSVGRRALLEKYLPWASAIDVELRCADALRGVTDAAAARGVPCVISHHDFRRTPPLARLRGIVRDARRAGAGVVKVATQLRHAGDLAVLLLLQAVEGGRGLATMGMGPLGRVSRLALAAAGSRLNYGYLDRAQVPGQWPARRLRELIGEIGAP